MPKNILVTGANGQVGTELKQLSQNAADTFFFTDRESLNITNKQSLELFCEEHQIDAILNCAAYTAVDKAESDEDNATTINADAVSTLADIAKKRSLSLIHLSTDYVFDGQNFTPYKETDSVSPQSVYGQTKQMGEKALLDIAPAKSIIIRTSWVYSSFGTNFVKTMLRLGKERDSLGVIFDQVGTPTYARDLAKAMLDILPQLDEKQTPEIYHYTNEGVCSWYDFAKAIFELSGVNCKVNPIETKDYPTPAKRPHYSVLNKSKIKQTFNIEIPYWRNSLKSCLNLLKEAS